MLVKEGISGIFEDRVRAKHRPKSSKTLPVALSKELGTFHFTSRYRAFLSLPSTIPLWFTATGSAQIEHPGGASLFLFPGNPAPSPGSTVTSNQFTHINLGGTFAEQNRTEQKRTSLLFRPRTWLRSTPSSNAPSPSSTSSSR